MAHPGVPHMFVPTGLFATVMPRLALANLREEREALFARGARSRSAQPSHDG